MSTLQSKINRNERAGQIPFGWQLTKDNNTLTEIQEQQQAITLVKDLRSQGYSLRAICQQLTQQGFQPLGKQWYPKTVRNILKKVA